MKFGEVTCAAKYSDYGKLEGILGLGLSESSQSSPLTTSFPTVCFFNKIQLKEQDGNWESVLHFSFGWSQLEIIFVFLHLKQKFKMRLVPYHISLCCNRCANSSDL